MQLISKRSYQEIGLFETEFLYELGNTTINHVTYNRKDEQIKVMTYHNGKLHSVEEHINDSQGRLLYENHYDENERLTHYFHFLYDDNGNFMHDDYYEVD